MATISKKIFVDSSILIAFIDRGDPNHLRASKVIEDMASLGCRLYTSPNVLIDSYAQLSRDAGITVALEFLQTMLQSSIEILFPQKADLLTAHRILRVNRDEKITLSEAINATLMQRKGIIQVLTFSSWNKFFGTYVSNLAIT